MQLRSLWKLLVIGFFAFLVVACKPIASFSVTPTPVKAGVVATFDASASIAYFKPKNNTIKSYAWDFGDGSTANGKTATHTYAAAGTFKVKLTVIDTEGRKGEATESVVVAAGDGVVAPTTTSLKVITQIAGGVSPWGAEVTVGLFGGSSNDQGLVKFDALPVGENLVVKVKKAGYVTQSVRVSLTAGDEPKLLLVVLMPEKDTLSIANIENAQTILSNYLGASVKLPAGALVNASTGAAATGAATLKLTPWDISGIDLQAMPGNGRALDSTGNLVDLISAGMMTVDFFDAAGNKLQVAAGKTATIQMNLPAGTTSIGGNAIAAGTSIPLWHFDEAQGLWVGEGNGDVVATSTGLAVTATVSHFSTWNWDYVARPIVGGSISLPGSTPPATPTLNVSCVDGNSALIECSVVATVTYADGSSRFWATSLPAAVSPIQNMPAGSSIHWDATAIGSGLKGSADSSSTGNVVIRIKPATTRNFVRCFTQDNSAKGCTVDMTAPLTGGTSATQRYYLPTEGATIITQLETVGPLSWSASTGFAPTAGGTWTNYLGAAASELMSDVTIVLAPNVASTGKTIFVSCEPNAVDSENQPVPLTSCSIRISVYSTMVTVNEINIPSGLNGPIAVPLPLLEDGATVYIEAVGGTTISQDWPFGGRSVFIYNGLQNNQQIVIPLYTQVAT